MRTASRHRSFARRAFWWVLLVAVLSMGQQMASVPAFAASRTWTGAGTDNNWTTPANWGGIAPVAGDSLLFPAGAARLSNTNDYPPGTAFVLIGISGSGYNLSGNTVSLSAGLAATHSSSSVTVSLPISGAGGVTVSGAGRLVLSGPNSFIGQVRVEDGALRVKHASALGSASGNTVVLDAAGPDGALEIEGSFTIGESILLDGSAHALLRQVSGNTTITPDVYVSNPSTGISVVSGQLTFNGDILNGGIFKVGAGRLILNGSVAGYLDIGGGTVILNGTVAGRLDLAPNTVVSGGGSAALIVSDGGLVEPGPGVLTSLGAVTFNADSVFSVDIHGTTAGSGYSQLVTGGVPSLGGATLSLDWNMAGLPPVGTVFTIIRNLSGSPVLGTFSNAPEGLTFTRGHAHFALSYRGGSGDDVTVTLTAIEEADLSVDLTASPEPAAPGSALQYAITVANAGPFAARDVQLIMPVSEGMGFVSHAAPGGWTCTIPAVGATGQLRCTRGSVEAGAAFSFSLTVRIDPARVADLRPKAVVISSTPDAITHNNTDDFTTHLSGVPSQFPFRRVLPGLAKDGP